MGWKATQHTNSTHQTNPLWFMVPWSLSLRKTEAIVAQSLSRVLTLCDPMDCSTPCIPILQHLPEFAQTHIHWVSDAIQPSHLLSSPSPPAFNLSQNQGLFQWVGSLHQVAKVLEFQLQYQSFQWIFRVDFLQDWLVWSPYYPRVFQESSPAPQPKSISSLVPCLFYGPTLASVHATGKTSLWLRGLCQQRALGICTDGRSVYYLSIK